MAAFCMECSKEILGEDFGDLRGLCKEGATTYALCEGCSGPKYMTLVDHEGRRVGKKEQN